MIDIYDPKTSITCLAPKFLYIDIDNLTGTQIFNKSS